MGANFALKRMLCQYPCVQYMGIYGNLWGYTWLVLKKRFVENYWEVLVKKSFNIIRKLFEKWGFNG